MNNKKTIAPTESSFRQRAEEDVKENGRFAHLSEVEVRALCHELEVHQIELEMQNEELKRVHADLAASKEKYRDLYEFAPTGYLTLDGSGKILDANFAAAAILGTERANLVSHLFQAYLAEGSALEFKAFCRRAIDSDAKQTAELQLRTAPESNGLARSWVLVNGRAVQDGINHDFQVAVIDISEQKRADEALRASEEKYRTVVETAGEGIVIARPEGNYFYVNQRMADMLGYSVGEILGKSILDFTFDEGRAQVLQARKDLHIGDELHGEFKFRRKDGSVMWSLYNASPMFNDKGEHVANVSMHTDITERKKAEEEIQKLMASVQQEKDKLLTLVNSIPDEVWFADAQKKISLVNPAVLNEFGYSTFDNAEVEAIAGSSEVYRPDGTPRPVEEAPPLRALKGEIIKNQEEIVRTPASGELRYRQVNAVPVKDANGNIIGSVSVVRDITERKRMEEELRKAKDELESRIQERTAELLDAKDNLEVINQELRMEIDEHEKTEKKLLKAKDEAEAGVKAKSLFLANMSHELRTPMNAVIGFTGLLLDEPLTPEQKDYLVSIRNSGNALLALISDLLDFSRMERENVEIEDQPFDLRSCIEEALDQVAPEASKKNLDLAYSIDKDMPEAITGDPTRLRQVLVNLLGNAVKFTKEGEAVLSVLPKGQDEILFEIRDTGIGIHEDKVNILFQPFSRVDESLSSMYEGAGLGLAISKKLVEMMGGRIWVESAPGQGSTFSFTIKAKAVPGKPKAIPTGIQPKLQGKQLLIVDDNKTNRIILGKQLHSWGMIPVPKPSGQEALALIRGGAPFDAAFLDMKMPEIDGIALAKEIRKYRKDLPLILLSSAGQRGKPELFEASLNKPIKPAQLYQVLSDTLAAQQSREEAESLGADAQASHSPMRILLAEDNVSNQRVTLEMLKKLGYRADAVANGAEAIQALERQPYDLILMDIKMPVLGGIEATRMIKERWPDNGPKIVAITAYALHGDKEKCLAAGMDGYISKPVEKEDLVALLRNITTKNKI